MVVSVLAVAAGLGTAGYIGWFYWRSAHVGGSLIHREQSALKSVSRDQDSCRATGSPPSTDLKQKLTPSTLLGLLSAPSIHLKAPVVEGVGNAQLEVAVGHLPASALPGRSGTGVLSAHDVTWFSQIDRLKAGDQILFEEPCSTFHYRVESGKVVEAGAPIYTSSASKLALVTCYPLNALFITSKRYVIIADLEERTSNQKASVSTPPAVKVSVSVPAPSDLVAQGLTLAQNNAPLGTLSFQGNPPLAVTESPLPIQLESDLLELYFAAIHSAEQNRADWWSSIAAGIPFQSSAPLRNATITYNHALVEPTLVFSGETFTGATITSEPTISGGSQAGTYSLTMKASVKGSELLMSGWSMSPQRELGVASAGAGRPSPTHTAPPPTPRPGGIPQSEPTSSTTAAPAPPTSSTEPANTVSPPSTAPPSPPETPTTSASTTGTIHAGRYG